MLSFVIKHSLPLCLLSSFIGGLVLTTVPVGIVEAQINREINITSSTNANTDLILQSIAKIEVERALNLARFKPETPMIRRFDAQLQNLYKQLANTQPQVNKRAVRTVILNAANQKMNAFKIERSQLLRKFAPNHPVITSIDSQTNQLKALIHRNK